MVSHYLTSIVNLLLLLLAIAFYTLVERKMLGMIMTRVGPNKPSFIGLLTPIGDALKLLSKDFILLKFTIKSYFLLSPFLQFFFMLILWVLMPNSFNESGSYSFLWFLIISSLSVYTVFIGGWASNSKYSLIGALRSVAQMISFEVSFGLLVMALIFSNLSFNMAEFSCYPKFIYFVWSIFGLWIFMMLMEANRAPFDLVEGESELVSGFLTEYGGLKFVMFFLAEYGVMIFLSLMSSKIFFSSPFDWTTTPMMLLLVLLRGAYPRIRYDQLMMFSWKSVLPLTLGLVMIMN